MPSGKAVRNDPSFRFFCEPVTIGDGCWVGAFARLGPGTEVAPGTVIGAGGQG